MEKKLYTMEDFRKGGLAVAIRNEREREKFLSMCEKNGILWTSGKNATEYLPPKVLPYAITCGYYTEGRLTWMENTTGAILLSQITVEMATPHYKIIIECDDNKTTVARLLVDGREVKRREARCNPADRFSLRKGTELAFGRLWDKQAKPEKKPAVREVKRHARAGEWVKVVHPFCTCGLYHCGDILRTNWVDGAGSILVKGMIISICPSEYVVLEGYKPDNEKHVGGKDRGN